MNVKTLINKIKKAVEKKVEVTKVQVDFHFDFEENKEMICASFFFKDESGRIDNNYACIYSDFENYNVEGLIKEIEQKLTELNPKTSISYFKL